MIRLQDLELDSLRTDNGRTDTGWTDRRDVGNSILDIQKKTAPEIQEQSHCCELMLVVFFEAQNRRWVDMNYEYLANAQPRSVKSARP